MKMKAVYVVDEGGCYHDGKPGVLHFTFWIFHSCFSLISVLHRQRKDVRK